MTGFTNVSHFVDCELSGGFQMSSFRKVPAITTTAGVWADLSMAPGNPSPNYYVGAELESTVLNANKGIYHGQNVGSSSTKVLKELMIQSPTAGAAVATYLLCDYLMFYPLVDMDVTDPQEFNNTLTLPRYSTGAGVRAFLVATNPYIGGATVNINYTNQDGVAGRVSPNLVTNTATNIATLVSGGQSLGNSVGPFLPLQSGDTGIRSVQSITFSASNGGLAALVLCRPLARIHLREVTAPHEKNYLVDSPSLPIIQDGAYLNFLILPSATILSANIQGLATFVWSK